MVVPASSAKVSIVIVEGESLYRDLLRIALSEDPALNVVGAFADGTSALKEIPQLNPQVAVLDIDLGDSINGIQLGLLLRQQLPDLGIVLLSNHADPEFLLAVSGPALIGWSYLLKKSLGDVTTLRRAIQGSAQQLIVLDPLLVAGLKARSFGLLSRLSPRQQQVLDLIAQGYTNAGIGEALSVTEKSVENQINQLYQVLGIERGTSGTHPRVKAVLLYLQGSQTAWHGKTS